MKTTDKGVNLQAISRRDLLDEIYELRKLNKMQRIDLVQRNKELQNELNSLERTHKSDISLLNKKIDDRDSFIEDLKETIEEDFYENDRNFAIQLSKTNEKIYGEQMWDIDDSVIDESLDMEPEE